MYKTAKIMFAIFIIAIVIWWGLFRSESESTFTVEIVKGSIDEGFAISNLYSPIDLKPEKVANSEITISWNFVEKNFATKPGLDPRYAVVSGFRIYRDGFWFADVPKNQTLVTDAGLFPGEFYKYKVVTLTFDNKVEGEPSREIEVKTSAGSPNPITNFTKGSFEVFLVEGASVAEGQKVPPGLAWADQVVASLTKNGNSGLQLFNRAISGSLSSEVADRIGKEINNLKDREGLNPDLVIVDTAGINDLVPAKDLSAKARGTLSIDSFRKNVEKIIREVKPSKERSLILLNISYFNCCKAEASNERNHQKRAAWNKLIRDVANAHGLILVDVEKAMIDSGGEDFFSSWDKLFLLEDELHPHAKAHDIMARAIIEQIEKYKK